LQNSENVVHSKVIDKKDIGGYGVVDPWFPHDDESKVVVVHELLLTVVPLTTARYRMYYMSIATCLLSHRSAAKITSEIRGVCLSPSVSSLAMTFSTCRLGIWRMANYLSGRIESETSTLPPKLEISPVPQRR